MIQEKSVLPKKSPFCSCIFGHKSSKSAVSARNICGKQVLHVEYANAQKPEQRVTRMNESRRLIKTKPNQKKKQIQNQAPTESSASWKEKNAQLVRFPN